MVQAAFVFIGNAVERWHTAKQGHSKTYDHY
jgi:hypothetical protein